MAEPRGGDPHTDDEFSFSDTPETDAATPKQPINLQKVAEFLARRGFKDAEQALLREYAGNELPLSRPSSSAKEDALNTDDSGSTAKVILSYQSKNDPNTLKLEYKNFLHLLESMLDSIKAELGLFLYPLFAHMYLELICNNHRSEAEDFFAEFAELQESFWKEDVGQLQSLTDAEMIKASAWFGTFHEATYVLRISAETLRALREYFKTNLDVERIIKTHMHVEVFDGSARNADTAKAYAGGILGEATKAANKQRVLYGLIKEASFASLEASTSAANDGDETGADGKKKKKAKAKDALLAKRLKSDPNAPPPGRIPLPELSELVREEKLAALRESLKRTKIGPDALPSVCYYTILNAASRKGANCCEITEDTELLAVGFGNSSVQVFALDPEERLKPLKSAAELKEIDKDADDVWTQAFDAERSTDTVKFIGHSGSVYGVSFSPDKTTLLTASEDSTVRLWSLQTWSNLVVYRTPGFPVWDVDFSPYGHYFATGGADRNGLLWVQDRPSPLRVLQGHFADVNVVQFHPNCNYIATGSADRTIRLFDVLTGNTVRYFTGHKGTVHALQFSPDGRFLASGGADGRVLLWDLGFGTMIADIHAHDSCVYAVSFSRDGLVLVSSGADSCVKIHQVEQLMSDAEVMDVAWSNPKIDETGELELTTYMTKSTPTVHLHFTRRNLLIGVGVFGQ